MQPSQSVDDAKQKRNGISKGNSQTHTHMHIHMYYTRIPCTTLLTPLNVKKDPKKTGSPYASLFLHLLLLLCFVYVSLNFSSELKFINCAASTRTHTHTHVYTHFRHTLASGLCSTTWQKKELELKVNKAETWRRQTRTEFTVTLHCRNFLKLVSRASSPEPILDRHFRNIFPQCRRHPNWCLQAPSTYSQL